MNGNCKLENNSNNFMNSRYVRDVNLYNFTVPDIPTNIHNTEYQRCSNDSISFSIKMIVV